MIAPRISGFGQRLKLPPSNAGHEHGARLHPSAVRDGGPCLSPTPVRAPGCSTDTDTGPGAAGLTYFDDNLP
jgi:hypothetical protein